jgi:EAL domain-containing protein (putative c-di-GMP-specific phosphodiesterase class I)
MIEDFDLLLIQRTLELLRDRAKNGWQPTVAVNVSGKSIGSNMFVKQLRKIMAEFDNIKKQLSFEITETSKVYDYDRLNKVILMLRKSGHKVYLDDVGSGNTSFETLHGLRVDAIKIEGQYVQKAMSSKRDMAILKSIAEIARQFNIRMIGEMIDSENQVTTLRNLKVQFGQGYLFGKPTIDVKQDTFGVKGLFMSTTTQQSW